MGPEGAVRLGFRAELERSPIRRHGRPGYDELVAEYYSGGQGVNTAQVFEHR